MNFNIVEKQPIVIDDVYDEIKEKYLHTTQRCEDIRVNYGLSFTDWKYITRRIRDDSGIKSRPAINAKHYSKSKQGNFRIKKRINGKNVYICSVESEKKAKELVRRFDEKDWDINEIKKIAKEYGLEGVCNRL